MSVPQLVDLLLRWEELHEGGQSITPEELCRDCPELVDELRRRIQALQALNPALDAASHSPTVDPQGSARTTSDTQAGPPRSTAVPGYHILEELGRGGMGVVYKARQTSLGRLVALKMILSGAHAGTQQRARFRGEAEAAARLQHANIVQVYEVGEQDGCPYFSLEYVDGHGLNEVILDDPPSPLRAAALTEQLARAVYYAHQHGIIHRDLKPANILLAKDGTPKVTDFGLAKRLDEEQARTRTGDVMGTPSYMAPEQAAGKNKEIGPATDIHALGAILYEMLTGVPPFEGPSAWDTVSLVLSAEPEPPSRRNSRVPRDLETICLKCLQKEPAKRYASGLALAEDLRRFQAGEPIQARPVGWVERTAKWLRRRPAVATLLIISAASLLVLLVGGWLAAIKLYQGNQALKAAYKDNHAALVRLNVTNGSHYLDEGDLFESLIWFTRALKFENDDTRCALHRVRLAAVLRECPRLSQLWFHDGSIDDVTFSPDGRWVLTASADYTARVWDAATGKMRFDAPLRHDYFILRASFNGDGSQIVTASADRTACVWDAATGRQIAALKGHTDVVRDARFSPDGSRVITASADRTARLWDAATGEPFGEPLSHNGAVVRASFHPSGKQVLTASSDGTARIWQIGSERAEVVAEMKHEGPLNDACFDREGNQVATASEDRTACVWNAATGEPITDPLRHSGAVLSVVFRPDGQRIATASTDLAARIWDAKSGQVVVPQLRHSSPVTGVSFSLDGTKVATASEDNTARVWDGGNGRPLTPPLPHNGNVNQVCFSPDGLRVATAADDTTARVYELVLRPLPIPPLEHGGPVRQASFSADGTRVLTASAATARVWDAKTGEALAVLRGHEGAVLRAVFSRDGRRILTAGADATARVWDTASGNEIVTLKGHKRPVRTALFNPDASRVLTASDDGSARIWDAASGAQVVELSSHDGAHREEILDAVFSPDGRRVATGSADRTARIWDADTGKQVGQKMSHGRRVVRVAFSPDGRRLATASFDQTARLWDAATGVALVSTLEHAGPVRDVSFSKDGLRLLTASDDNTARVWDAVAGTQLLPPLWHKGTVGTAHFSADGKRIVTSSEDNSGRVWDAASGEPLTPGLRHPGWGGIRDAAFNPTGDRVVTASDDGTARVWELGGNDWPVEDLEQLAELLGGGRIGADSGSRAPLEARALRRLWQQLGTRYPGEAGHAGERGEP